ncbi:MAG: response regulator transcription factor [Pirellulales bacterium]
MAESPIVTVVDDDEQVRESLAALIQSIGVEVEAYASGQEFLHRYVHLRPGCIVLDLRMPQVSGQEVLTELAARRIDVPVIMVTGHGDIPAAVAAMKAGAIDFLEKPYRGAALLDAVRRAIATDERSFQAKVERHDLLARYESLTADERDVLWLTAEGKPDKAIALRLDLSLRTIQLRRASVMRKMQASSRAGLIRLAQTLEQMPAATG